MLEGNDTVKVSLIWKGLKRPSVCIVALQYNQVPRILNPVVLAMDALPHLYKDPHVKVHIDSLFGDVETARQDHLH